MFLQHIAALAGGMAFVVEQGVAVADYAGRWVVAGDGQGVAQRCGDRLREACDHATGNHQDATHVEGLQAIGRAYSESAGLSQCFGIGLAAITEVFLVDSQFTGADIQPANGDRIVVVLNLQHQLGRAGVTVGVMQGVGKGFAALAV
ncbi:hypothetical protein D9M71_219870 [compost metagenome]